MDYKKYVQGEKRDKFSARLKELIETANYFINEAGYSKYVRCDERIMTQVLLDYYSDVERLKDFHDIERIRTEKIIAYTVAWIVKRKPLQFVKFPDDERDTFVNGRFAAYLMLNECMFNEKMYIHPKYGNRLQDYINLVMYYLKYRECNPQVIELAIESFKMGVCIEQ